MSLGILVISVVSFIASVIAIFVSIMAWHKNRAIYDIESFPLRSDSIGGLRAKLNSGKYTILAVHDETLNPSISTKVLLGKVKE